MANACLIVLMQLLILSWFPLFRISLCMHIYRTRQSHTLSKITMNKYLQNNILYCLCLPPSLSFTCTLCLARMHTGVFWHRILIEFKLVSCENLCVQNYGKHKIFLVRRQKRSTQTLHFSTNNIPLLQ